MREIVPLRGEGYYKQKAEEWFAQGMYAVTKENYEEALDCFKWVYRFDPSREDAQFYAGLNAYIIGRFQEAIASFKALHVKYPENFEYTYRYARGLYENDEIANSLPLFRTIPLSDEFGEQAHFYAAKALHHIGCLGEAVSHLVALLARTPDRVDIRFELASVYAESGKWHVAVEELKRCVETDDCFPLAYYLLHDLYAEKGFYEEAVHWLHALTEKCPQEAEVAKETLSLMTIKRRTED